MWHVSGNPVVGSSPDGTGNDNVAEIKCPTMRAIPKSTSDWLVKKGKNREQNFITYKTYIHNCITFPHSCHPNSGTCRTVTPAFAIPCHRTAPPGIQPVVDSIHELLVGFEALVS
jgi:hypothetical protein